MMMMMMMMMVVVVVVVVVVVDYDRVYDKLIFYDTSGTLNSTLKASNAPYGVKERQYAVSVC